MKTKDPETSPLLPVLERIAGALERIGDASQSLNRMADTVERLEAVAQRYERLQRIAIWNERYATLETIITPDKLETMKAMIDEFVWQEYREKKFRTLGMDGFQAWLRKILTTQRVYEYMMLTTHLGEWPKAIQPDESGKRLDLQDLHDEDYAIVKWLREMVLDEDFRMVYYRQGAFYPRYSDLVNSVLHSVAKVVRKKGQIKLAIVMERTAEANGATVAFYEFNALGEEDPERYRISEFIRSKGENPEAFRGFRLIWAQYPGWIDSDDPTPAPDNLLYFPDPVDDSK